MTDILVAERIPSSDVDQIIGTDTPFALSLPEQEALCASLCRQALAYHLERCERYRRYFELESDRLRVDHADPATFPVIPTAVFKTRSPLSVSPPEVDKWCTSSGTRGPLSRVPRTRTSIERLLGSVRAGLTLVSDWHEDEVEVVHLGPSHEEAGDIWFPFVMSLAELLHPATNCAQGDRIDHSVAERHITAGLKAGRQVVVIGAPFALLDFARSCGIDRHSPVERLHVITGGGWKRWNGVRIEPTAFRTLLTEALGVPPSQIRDAFNQVELNTVLIECEAHRKHVPPWVWPAARHPHTLEARSHGETGLLSFVDASADAYPGFIVSDDVGLVRRGRCDCGRDAVTVEFLRRIEGGGQRGCALSLDAAYGAAA